MYGYIKPLKGELKVREYEQYKAAYCGLCHALKGLYGASARFCVNYDLTYLAMLLENGKSPEFQQKRCMSCALRKKTCCAADEALDRAAGCCVILSWWKLADMGEDGGLWDKLKAFGGRTMLRGAYKKAKRDLPEFELRVREKLKELSELEREKNGTLDLMADKFAAVLEAAAPSSGDELRDRVLSQLLYHTGRWIYIIDAADDLKQDMERGDYNPVAARFALEDHKLSDEQKQYLDTTLKHSSNLIGAAFELLEENAWSDIVRNIIYLGMPWTADQVLAGEFARQSNKRPK